VQTALFKEPVRTAQYTLFISVLKTNQFVLVITKVGVCSEINTKHLNTEWAESRIVGMLHLLVHQEISRL
jgi:hypothetical protein